MKVYIAGPITGIPDRNRHAFEAAAIYLSRMGYETVSPLEVNPPGSCSSWNEAMRRDIPHLVSCDAVYLLPGWEKSRGAQIEQRLAFDLGLEILTGDPGPA